MYTTFWSQGLHEMLVVNMYTLHIQIQQSIFLSEMDKFPPISTLVTCNERKSWMKLSEGERKNKNIPKVQPEWNYWKLKVGEWNLAAAGFSRGRGMVLQV